MRCGPEMTQHETAWLTSALDSMADEGLTLAALIDPDEWRSAVQMLALGDVEMIVAHSPRDLPGVAIGAFSGRRLPAGR